MTNTDLASVNAELIAAGLAPLPEPPAAPAPAAAAPAAPVVAAPPAAVLPSRTPPPQRARPPAGAPTNVLSWEEDRAQTEWAARAAAESRAELARAAQPSMTHGGGDVDLAVALQGARNAEEVKAILAQAATERQQGVQ